MIISRGFVKIGWLCSCCSKRYQNRNNNVDNGNCENLNSNLLEIEEKQTIWMIPRIWRGQNNKWEETHDFLKNNHGLLEKLEVEPWRWWRCVWGVWEERESERESHVGDLSDHGSGGELVMGQWLELFGCPQRWILHPHMFLELIYLIVYYSFFIYFLPLSVFDATKYWSLWLSVKSFLFLVIPQDSPMLQTTLKYWTLNSAN